MDRGDFVVPPLPNLLFTRDSSVWVGDEVAVTSLAMPARHRESTITAAVYTHHPRFAGVEQLYGAHLEHLEGGDVLLLAPGVVAVGVGERTTPGGAERLARRVFARGLAHTVLVVPIAQQRATMHLDTIATMVDVDAMVMYPAVADSLVAWTVTPPGPTRRADDADTVELVRRRPAAVRRRRRGRHGHRPAAGDRHRPRPGHRRARAVGRRQQHPRAGAAAGGGLRAEHGDQRRARGRRHRGGARSPAPSWAAAAAARGACPAPITRDPL